MSFLLKSKRHDFRAFVTVPTSMVKRLTGEETWTDNITFATGKGIANAGAASNTLTAATAAAYTLTDGTTAMLVIDTRTTTSGGGGTTVRGQPVSLSSAGSDLLASTWTIAAKTATLTGTTTTTSLLGVALNIGIQTVTDASVCTLTTASVIHIAALAAAGGSLTITNSRMISTGVADCFLTNAGVWTDTGCWASIKNGIDRAGDKAEQMIGKLVDQLKPATWKYNDSVEAFYMDDDGKHVSFQSPLNDFGRERVGIVYDDLPGELRAPGEERGVSAGLLSSFALAAIKMLYEQNKRLEARLAALEP